MPPIISVEIPSTLHAVLTPMNQSRLLTYSTLLATLLALGACGMAPTISMSKTSTTQLSGTSEVPPVMGSASGTMQAKLDTQSNVLTWTIAYSGLTGPATAGHFHGPAQAGQNAGVALPLAGSLASPIRGSATLSAAQLADVMSGKWYINLHTAANPGGEIRGQLNLQP